MSNLKNKAVSILIMLSMAFVLFGCGASNDKEAFLGTWEATVDMTDLFSENFQQGVSQAGDDVAEYFNISKFELTMVFTFNEDDTFSMAVDEDRASEAIEGVKADLKDGFTKYFEDIIAEQELDMSVDDVLALSGMTMDGLIDESMSAEMFDSVFEEFETSGKWKAEGGKLYTTESEDENIDKSGYELYKITSDGIELSEPDGVEDELGIFPLVLKKAK